MRRVLVRKIYFYFDEDKGRMEVVNIVYKKLNIDFKIKKIKKKFLFKNLVKY